MPTGGPPPSMGGQKNTTSIEDIDKAIESLNREGLHAQEKATKLLELEHAKEVLKQQYVRSAAVVTGQLQNTQAAGNIKITDGSSSEVERNQAKLVQSASIAASAIINFAWLTYFGEDAPSGLYEIVAVTIPIFFQAAATAYNNKKPK